MTTWGLNFIEARKCVKVAIENALSEYERELQKRSKLFLKKHFEVHLYLTVPALICATFFSFSVIFDVYPLSYNGIIVAVIILGLVAWLNRSLIFRVLKTEKLEALLEIKQVLVDYNDWLDAYTGSISTHGPHRNPHSGVVLGHPHVSLVSCWRNGLWQRIPVLLLAEGDVIALMGGDTTPGLVNELLPTNKTLTNPDGTSRPMHWKLGSKIKPGQTIRLRRSNDGSSASASQYAQHSFVKHRSLPPDSIELLILSGDIRCFQMAETPITDFVKNLLLRGDSSSADVSFFEKTDHEIKGECGGQSYLRKVFVLLLKIAATRFLPALLAIYLSSVAIRHYFFSILDFNFVKIFFVPVSVIVLCFVPLSMPLCFLICESLVLGDILATTEASLEESLKITIESTPLGPRSSNPLKERKEINQKVVNNDSLNSQNPSSDDSEDDEFLDEDIDDREEEIAEEASKLVSWKRFAQYVIHIFLARLGNSQDMSLARLFGHVPHFLPIPHIRARLLEILGGVTMVCFVDDDIICEGYSVTEEIYLLVTGEKDLAAGRKGTILDLHANPEAEGSRFENPLWWKFLPNLKPIALNSMLTFSSIMSTEVLLKQAPHIISKKRGSNNQQSSSSLFDGIALLPNTSSRSSRLKSIEGSSKESRVHRVPTDMEKELVRHVRKTIPLESLNELAEEIGFTPDDASMFTKLFELNVLAPRLGDAQLLEDYHAWGQEETRRRGTLLAQVRSVIVKDSRGGLQMMSQGDPSLILKYCREFWDGASIATLNVDDRKDILNLNDRYRKEDFDVVCFAYSPIPVALQPLILAAVSNKMDLMSSESINQKIPLSLGEFEEGNVQCLLFVDPSTANELMEANTMEIVKEQSTRRRGSQSEKNPFKSNPTLPNLHESHGDLSSKSNQATEPAFATKPLDFVTIYDKSGIEEYVDIENPTTFDITTSVTPSAQDASVLLSAIIESPRNESALLRNAPLSTTSAKVSRGISSDMRSLSESNLARTLSQYPEAIMLTNTESLNCETLIHEMEQLDSHEELRVLQEDGMMNSEATISLKLRSDSMAEITNEDPNIASDSKPEFIEISFHDAEILDESLMESEDIVRPRRHSFDDETVSELMSSSARSKSLSIDGEEHAPSLHAKSTSFAFSRTEREHFNFDKINDLWAKQVTVEPESVLSRASPPGSLTRSRTKSLDSVPISESFANDLLVLGQSIDNSRAKATSKDGEAKDDFSVVKSPKSSPSQLNNRNFSALSFQLSSIQRSVNRGQSPNDINLETDKKSNSQRPDSREPKKRSLGAQLWPLMRQQVFLGLAASSVPVKPEVPDLLENLNSAGVRFIYFSPRNMRRSKPVAEKIGIQFDWNCAISLRPLGSNDKHDPHRYISSYADWDVHARLPHGVEDIKRHLQEVDNVPLLVNLYTDATPSSTCEMIGVFKAYGEVVLTIGSSFRSSNQQIFHNSDVGVAVAMLPGSSSHIPSSVDAVLAKIPLYSEISLSQSDMILVFRLVGLGSIPLLQLPSTLNKDSYKKNHHRHHRLSSVNALTSAEPEQLRLASITESIRKGRLFFLNTLQVIAFQSVSSLSLAIWPIVAQAIPMSIAPTVPAPIALLFLLWYIPIIAISIILCDTSEGVMKNTPRKSVITKKQGDETRFLTYLMGRVVFVVLSVLAQGWVTASSVFRSSTNTPGSAGIIHIDLSQTCTQTCLKSNLVGFWLVQDVMASQLLLQVVCQAASLLERGQKIDRLPTLKEHTQFYVACFAVFFTHVWIMFLRARSRFQDSMSQTYYNLDWTVWLVMICLPICSIGVGLLINRFDDKSYRRYMQFLRLEFDTKLGMHSPK